MSTMELEEREVRAEDPTLSAEANRLLTVELREVVGGARVRVPHEAPERHHDGHATAATPIGLIVRHRLLFVVTFIGAITVGVIVSLLTGSWWAVVGATALHAAGTLIVASTIIQLTTETEHVAPTTAAKLEAEGVRDPDQLFTDLLEEYAGATRARGVAEVISTGHNTGRTTASEQPLEAAVEQRSALTPASAPTRPAGDRSAIATMPWWAVLPVAAAAIAVPAILGGGILWAITGVTLPVVLGWLVLQRGMGGEELDEQDATGPQRALDDTGAAMRRRLAPIAVVVFGGVVGFMVAMGVIATLL